MPTDLPGLTPVDCADEPSRLSSEDNERGNQFIEQLTGYTTEERGGLLADISAQLRTASAEYDSSMRCDMCHSKSAKLLKCSKVRLDPVAS